MQKQYGKTQAELAVLVEGFALALADYAMEDIKQAMLEYIKTTSDIPAPADIIKIIKENEKLKNYDPNQVPLDALLRYRARGIPLSDAQNQRLKDASL